MRAAALLVQHYLLRDFLLGDEPQPSEIFLGPARLLGNYAAQRFWSESVTGAMKRNRHPTAIGVTVALMTALLGTEKEAIADQGADDLSSSQRSEA
jgi:hypothetical protein